MLGGSNAVLPSIKEPGPGPTSTSRRIQDWSSECRQSHHDRIDDRVQQRVLGSSKTFKVVVQARGDLPACSPATPARVQAWPPACAAANVLRVCCCLRCCPACVRARGCRARARDRLPPRAAGLGLRVADLQVDGNADWCVQWRQHTPCVRGIARLMPRHVALRAHTRHTARTRSHGRAATRDPCQGPVRAVRHIARVRAHGHHLLQPLVLAARGEGAATWPWCELATSAGGAMALGWRRTRRAVPLYPCTFQPCTSSACPMCNCLCARCAWRCCK